MLGLMLALVGLALAAAAGAAATLAAQWYLFNRWISGQPSVSPQAKPAHEPFQLPEILAEALRSGDVSRPESCVAVNLVLQFLFRELRHSPQVRRWLHKKLSAEFAELLTRTTTGKLFDSVTVREINLGSQLPVLHSIAVREARIDPAVGHLEQLDLNLDMHYSGGFQLAVDANMLLGKAAYLAVTVTHLSGQARLQFQRHPYTHWSFSFYSEPRLELAVESQFQGRPLPQVTSLIISQIRKTLKKKHTLPHYKLRYKPFFRKSGLGEEEDEGDGVNRESPAGSLQVAVLEVTRLNYPNPPPAYVYCSLAVDATAWVEVVQRADSGSWLTVDATVVSPGAGAESGGGGGAALGVVFKQRFVAARYQPCVLVEAVAPRSPAAAAGVQRGDLLLAVDGRRVASLAQAARLLRAAAHAPQGDRCTLRLERRALLRGAMGPPPPSPSHPTPTNGAQAPPTPTNGPGSGPMLPGPGPGGGLTPSPSPAHSPDAKEGEGRLAAPESPVLRRRKLSVDPALTQATGQGGSDTDSGSSSPASVPGSPAKRLSTGGSGSQSASPEHRRSTDEGDPNDEGLQLHRTQELPRAQVISFEESLQFEVRPQHRYLNVSVWGRARDQCPRTATSSASSIPTSGSASPASTAGPVPDQLLGHVSLSLAPLLAECQAAGPLTHQLRPCVLLPPDPHIALNRSHPLAGHSGFEPCLCYGDILLAFLFTPVEAGMVPPQAQQQTPKISRPASPRELSSNPVIVSGNAIPLRRHDFLRTHFNRATQCEFCGKKIWLKDAVQCRDCAMTCHKKCVARCQEAAACSGGEPSTTIRRLSAQPEIVTTAAEEEPPPTPVPQQQSSLVGPPPFSLAGEEDVEALLERLLAHPNDDDLMAAAKTSGKQLYACLPLAERKMKINNMISKLKSAMDAETHARLALEGATESSSGRADPATAARNAFLIGKSDEKVQALAVLMLHFCAGLQHAQDLEDAAKRESADKPNECGGTQQASQ
ncbi:hypothetical protein R5R35_000842 [Gryllus longicercus]|uniref:PDZ domain-containing protein 8 n=1 Tax=Gryllus longicercus TaxID=2509291 RepID=A0AAN9VT45_9ORTH